MPRSPPRWRASLPCGAPGAFEPGITGEDYTMSRKRIGEGQAVAIFVRVRQEDAERLDKLAEVLPLLGRPGVMRAVIQQGVLLFEAALAERDETKRLAALARLCGMGGKAPPRG